MCGILCIVQYGGHSIDVLQALNCLSKLSPRGPDCLSHKIIKVSPDVEIFLGFTRLAIMDTSTAGIQPFSDDKNTHMICNGEIYNYKSLSQQFDIKMQTECDCEIILPLYEKVGFKDMIKNHLDAEFATIIVDENRKQLFAARDKFGVRPLYYGYNDNFNTIAFSSELKAIQNLNLSDIQQLEPNNYVTLNLGSNTQYLNFEKYYSYNKLNFNSDCFDSSNVEIIKSKVNHLLTQAVKKRLYADRSIGFLLSGGLDSSLIVAIATQLLGPDNIVCFSVGFEGSPDVEAAKQVVKYLGIKNHHIVPFSVELGISSIPEVIKTIETYDITTIRASTPQYIMAKYIKENTDIKVLLSGEGSDEIHGSYKYFRSAPNPQEFHDETIRLLQELYFFDNKRTDRTMAGNGLEVRVPFLDKDYVEYICKINPCLLMYQPDYIEKRIIRDAFIGYLPDEILYRPKEAFSDAVSSKDINWYKSIQAKADIKYTNEDLLQSKYIINKPQIKEALYYRDIFDEFYPERSTIIPHYWLPQWQENIVDPSATVLTN
ncbi:glutamine-dependent asparagine synthetase [Cotonvirus japonicus]|uniref:asparagine synthase (glutamine-hydrolyzing) n=1 Tax=Cotonvirus japonicus TaxID=2811091 RepID=A0ABM7NSD6_9VIRU|nr:glutamine-dependent asparagine synthetase [Cotonvirus japonicus]BCS83063.1 glutamine-dependent asparagine synthetase [Cotonvirus japonicus]